MYIQWFVKGICSTDSAGASVFDWNEAQCVILLGNGILSNWWRTKPDGGISPSEVADILTPANLDRHVHDYGAFGHETPFISLAAGSVERNAILRTNTLYSAIDTALAFATRDGTAPGYLYYGWVPVALNPAVELSGVAEAIRDLNVYHRWSQFQLEGEITAKIHIPSNQIERVELWDIQKDPHACLACVDNPAFVEPTPLLNVRELF
jgi:hypothetical protein